MIDTVNARVYALDRVQKVCACVCECVHLATTRHIRLVLPQKFLDKFEVLGVPGIRFGANDGESMGERTCLCVCVRM